MTLNYGLWCLKQRRKRQTLLLGPLVLIIVTGFLHTSVKVSSPPDGLHWLFILFRIQFKVIVGTFKALHGQAAAYIRGLLQSCDARAPVLINRWLLVDSRLKETVLLVVGSRPKNVFPLNQRSLHTNRHKHTFEEQILDLNSEMFWDVTYPDWHCSFPEMTSSDAALYLLIFLFGCSQPDDLSNLSGQPHSLLCDGLWRRKTQVHASTKAPSSRKTVLRARFGIFITGLVRPIKDTSQDVFWGRRQWQLKTCLKAV